MEWENDAPRHWGRYGSWVTYMPDPMKWRNRIRKVQDGMNMPVPDSRAVKNFAEEKAEKLIEAFLYALRNAVWQATYEKQRPWGRMSDEDFQSIFTQAFVECGMKFLMDNPKITRYINEISLYAFDKYRMDMQKTNSLRNSQVRTYAKELEEL